MPETYCKNPAFHYASKGDCDNNFHKSLIFSHTKLAVTDSAQDFDTLKLALRTLKLALCALKLALCALKLASSTLKLALSSLKLALSTLKLASGALKHASNPIKHVTGIVTEHLISAMCKINLLGSVSRPLNIV